MVKKSVTVRDVAKLAGVAASTVSRILNNKLTTLPVTEATRQRVFEAVKTLGYSPNRLARSLATAKTNVVGLYFPVTEPLDSLHHNEATWMAFGAMISGVQHITQQRGYEAHIFNRLEYDSGMPSPYRDVCPDFVDGLIYFEPNPRYDYFTRLAETGLPLVSVGPSPFSPLGYSVSADNRREIADIVRAMVRRGHKRIAYLLTLVNEPPLDCIERTEGYRLGVEEAGLPFDPALIPLDLVRNVSVREQTRRLLESPEPATALIIGRPEMAAEVMEQIHVSGLRYPEEIEVIVIGDDPSFPYRSPGISAMRMSFFDLGRSAAQMVIDIIDGVETEPKQVFVPWQYMRRESCGLDLDLSR